MNKINSINIVYACNNNYVKEMKQTIKLNDFL